MMKPKVIKNEADYQLALSHLETLMDSHSGTPEEEELELFAVLIENYERENFPIGLPDPVEAIKFRMEQQGLTRKDLEPYIGSQSKVSEVLNRKRSLSVAMIRALHKGLEIPAEVLLQTQGRQLEDPKYDYRQYPFGVIYKRGYFKGFNGTLQDAKEYAEELMEKLLAVFQGQTTKKVYCRNSEGQMDEYALEAWQARVLELASEQDVPPYVSGTLNSEIIRDVVKLSNLSEGPLHAQELLQKRGIPLVVLEHLPRTYLDGACFKSPTGRPVIGITLRHDRLDNFWFTLIHELAHAHLHLENSDMAFFDDTETGVPESRDPKEREANDFAANLLISAEVWKQWKKEKGNLINKEDIRDFAYRLGISPSIVAGRLRWETGEYKYYSQFLGHKTVKKIFEANR
ncbi:MAG: ImmA/IrrE family metallo-endopeptidase [Anaerolineales bacterium]|nr:ImmA/IrrE family metallo-endopeptidase [Anaerolineales bacterium]